MPRDRGHVPLIRVRAVNAAPPRAKAQHVLYWMTSARRLAHNFGLQRAAEHARERGLPLVVFEPLRAGYPWASRRLHRFVIDGMTEHEAALRGSRVRYHPYLEPEPGAGRGLLAALAAKAAVVVADEFPAFFLPRMLEAAGRALDVRLETVDSNGLLPLAATERAYPTAYAFRRVLQRELRPHLDAFPAADPLEGLATGPAELPGAIERRWPRADLEDVDLSRFPIDASPGPAPARGGAAAARAALARFGPAAYAEDRDHPDEDVASGLSPWLHFGHLSAHEVVGRIAAREGWTASRYPRRRDGRRGGWGMSHAAEAFLDQVVTWRELGYQFCAKRPDHDRYESLPAWARTTLEKHARDRREPLYALGDLEAARTHDALWNAAQTQLLREGRMHNYLRMLWGKKILEWTRGPREALEVLVHLNNKYALDGRDPNSYSGIFWCLGRFDRPWGPEREIFGTVRYMSSANAARKLRLKAYLARYGQG